ncbi:hypothetical protein BH10PLA2_BH10PLA2_27400 [soil metagenome]
MFVSTSKFRSLTWVCTALGLGLLSWCVATGGLGSRGQASQEPVADPLLTLNEAFREAYARCRQQMIDCSGPIIVVEGDNLVLIRDGKRTEVRVIPELFHTLKAVSHVPLAEFVMLTPVVGESLDEATSKALQGYRERVVRAEGVLPTRGLPEPILRRQQEIIKASLVFLDSVLQKKQVSRAGLDTFAREQGPKLLANAADAAQAELDALEQQMKTWHATLSEAEWSRFRVVIMGSAMPRTGNLAIQYFAQLLNEKGEGKRILYAEALFDEKRAVNLLGTHLVDTGIGTSFFNDPARMHRDLLADAATEYLKKNSAQP